MHFLLLQGFKTFVVALCHADVPINGDVALRDATGLVLIYMDSQWGTLNGLNYGSSVANTLCRQLGYEDGNIALKESYDSHG